jgi:hypothetical protein
MRDERILKSFRGRKVLTVEELTRLLKSSAVTARRRLKQWNAYTSINRNGRYYVLPEVAEFDEKGLWNHHMVFFSRHGNLRKTIVKLYIYFSEEEDFYLRQKEHREQLLSRREAELPADADAVLILVDRIKHPEDSIEQCARRLQKKMKHIRAQAIYVLLDYHGLLKKTPDTTS